MIAYDHFSNVGKRFWQKKKTVLSFLNYWNLWIYFPNLPRLPWMSEQNLVLHENGALAQCVGDGQPLKRGLLFLLPLLLQLFLFPHDPPHHHHLNVNGSTQWSSAKNATVTLVFVALERGNFLAWNVWNCGPRDYSLLVLFSLLLLPLLPLFTDWINIYTSCEPDDGCPCSGQDGVTWKVSAHLGSITSSLRIRVISSVFYSVFGCYSLILKLIKIHPCSSFNVNNHDGFHQFMILYICNFIDDETDVQ